jgi:hypothetical protein
MKAIAVLLACSVLHSAAWTALDAPGSKVGAAGGAAIPASEYQKKNPVAAAEGDAPSQPITPAAQYIPDDRFNFVPVTIRWDKVASESVVRLCRLNFANYHATPSVYPMVEDLISSSGCKSSSGNDWYEMTLGALEQEYVERGCSDAIEAGILEPSCAPSGIVFHESRCGSTVFSNMLASLPSTVIYSELGPPNAVIRANFNFTERVHWLRVVYAAMARPIALYGYHRNLGGVPSLLSDQTELAADWSPRYLYLKTQHTTSLNLDVYQAAFPQMPWVYLHRDPIEVMMSLLRDNTQAPRPDAPATDHINEKHIPYLLNVPCMRTRADKALAPQYIVDITNSPNASHAVKRTPAEDWCAADLSWVITAAVKAAVQSRREILARALDIASAQVYLEGDDGQGLKAAIDALTETDVSDGPSFASALLRLVPQCVVVRDGMVLDAETEAGTILGVGTTLFVDYTSIPHVVPLLMDSHLRPMSAWHRAGNLNHPRCLGLLRKARAAGMTESYSRTLITESKWYPSWDGRARSRGNAPYTPFNAYTVRTSHAVPFSAVWRDNLYYLTHPDAGIPMVVQASKDESSPFPYSPLASYTDAYSFALSGEDEATMMFTSQMYSKARATVNQLAALAHTPGGIRPFQRTGSGRLRAARAWTSINIEGKFIADTGAKQTMAWAALRAAAAKYLFNLRDVMVGFNVPFTEADAAEMDQLGAGAINLALMNMTVPPAEGEAPAPVSGASATQSGPEQRLLVDEGERAGASLLLPRFNPANLKLGKGYPQAFPLSDILTVRLHTHARVCLVTCS